MENSTSNISASVGIFHTFRRWALYRQLKHLIEYRKCFLLTILMVLATFGRYFIHQNTTDFVNQEILQTSERGSQLEIFQITSSPEIIQKMAERKKVFENRKLLAQSVCKNLTKDNPLYKPRNETLKFDILWDPHYQVRFIFTILQIFLLEITNFWL